MSWILLQSSSYCTGMCFNSTALRWVWAYEQSVQTGCLKCSLTVVRSHHRFTTSRVHGFTERSARLVTEAHLWVVRVAGFRTPPHLLGFHPVALHCGVMFTVVKENTPLSFLFWYYYTWVSVLIPKLVFFKNLTGPDQVFTRTKLGKLGFTSVWSVK